MTKLHELLAVEKTPTGAWNQLLEETVRKFKNPQSYYDGHSKSLAMLEGTDANKMLEAQNREEKSVPTTVKATLEFALGLFAKAETVQIQKNSTNALAKADVVFRDKTILTQVPVDELLGLESRLTKIRQMYGDIPTLDATKHWEKDADIGHDIWRTKFPEETTKTEKTMIAVELSKATDKHPAQVKEAVKEAVVGKYTLIRRSGAVTAIQKADAIELVDDLIVEIKRARMRANETEVQTTDNAKALVDLLMTPFG